MLISSTSGSNFPPELFHREGGSLGPNRKQLLIGTLKRGDSFGEHSALNDLPNPYTVEALTKEVHLYKILRGHLIQYFGGVQGDPVTQLRA